MFLLALHVVSIGILVVFVWAVAHGMGRRAGERQLRRRLGLDEQDRPVAAPSAARGTAPDTAS